MKRTWTIDADETGEVDQMEAMEAFADCLAIQRRLGGAIIVMPQRREHQGEHYTAALVYQWHSHAQVVKSVAEQQPENDPEMLPLEGDEPDVTQEMVAVNGD